MVEKMFNRYRISLSLFGPSSTHQIDRLLRRMCAAMQHKEESQTWRGRSEKLVEYEWKNAALSTCFHD